VQDASWTSPTGYTWFAAGVVYKSAAGGIVDEDEGVILTTAWRW
jgi:hypothetical protein